MCRTCCPCWRSTIRTPSSRASTRSRCPSGRTSGRYTSHSTSWWPPAHTSPSWRCGRDGSRGDGRTWRTTAGSCGRSPSRPRWGSSRSRRAGWSPSWAGGRGWDLLALGPRKARQRELIAEAIGPVWEANHVWLILAIVLLFTCFPPAFARLGTRLHIPLSLVLIGIVLRGSAFTFWRYGADEEQRNWGMVFAIASLMTPLLLGTTAGAIASGRVR